MDIKRPFDHIPDELLAQNSKAQYQCEYNKWVKYCEDIGIKPLPCKSEHFLKFLETRIGLAKYHAIKITASCVMTAHKYNALDPLYLGEQFDVIKRRARGLAEEIKQAPILRYTDLLRICKHPKISLRSKTACSLMFDALLRGDDMTQIKWTDFFYEENKQKKKLAGVTIYKAKGKHFHGGVKRMLSPRTMKLLNKFHVEQARGFKKVTNPKFYPWSTRTLATDFTHISKEIGTKYTTHSPRVGATTEMHEAGIEDTAIAKAAGWGSVNMVQYYSRKSKWQTGAMSKYMNKINERENIKRVPNFIKLYGHSEEVSAKID